MLFINHIKTHILYQQYMYNKHRLQPQHHTGKTFISVPICVNHHNQIKSSHNSKHHFNYMNYLISFTILETAPKSGLRFKSYTSFNFSRWLVAKSQQHAAPHTVRGAERIGSTPSRRETRRNYAFAARTEHNQTPWMRREL